MGPNWAFVWELKVSTRVHQREILKVSKWVILRGPKKEQNNNTVYQFSSIIITNDMSLS
jgi:hypothetical protein